MKRINVPLTAKQLREIKLALRTCSGLRSTERQRQYLRQLVEMLDEVDDGGT